MFSLLYFKIKNFYFLTILLILLGIVTNLHAQPPGRRGGSSEGGNVESKGKLSGRILEKMTDQPIEYATVIVMRSNDSIPVGGGSSDEKGNFLISNLPYGKFKIKIGFVGYKNYQRDSILIKPDNPEVNLGVINLNSTEVVTNDVVIEAERSAVQINAEKKTFEVGQMSVAQGGSAADVLGQIPSITIDQDGGAQMRGNADVIILIDGKPSNLTGGGRSAILEQIPANLIERVEVITNPSARYDPDGVSGIINIILKKNNKPGFFGSVNANAGTGDKYNGGISLSAGAAKWSANINYSYRYTDNFLAGNSKRENSLPIVYNLDQVRDGIVINKSNLGNATFEYRPSDRSAISLKGGISYRDNPKWETTSYQFSDSNRITTMYSTRPTTWLRDNLGYEVGLGYVLSFKQPEKSLSASVMYSRNTGFEDLIGLQNYRFVSGGDSSSGNRNQNTMGFYTYNSQIDFVSPLKNVGKHTKRRYELGAKNISRSTDQDFHAMILNGIEWSDNSKLTNQFVFTESIYSAYGIYAGETPKWDYQFGLRAEQTYTVSDQKTTKEKYHYDYFNLFPTVHLSYKLTDMRQLQLNYSRRIKRQDLEQVNPFIVVTDPYNVQVGNPKLKPEITSSFELQYVQFSEKFTLTATAYYRYTSNRIIRFREIEMSSDGPIPMGAAAVKFSNLQDNHSTGVEGILINRWFKWWNTTANLNIFYNELNDDRLGQAFTTSSNKVSNITWNGKIISNLTIKKKLEFQMSYNYRARNLNSQGIMDPMHSMDMGLKYSFMKSKLNVTLNVTDVFNTRQFSTTSRGYGYFQDFMYKRESRIVTLGALYSFGSLKNTGKQKTKKDREQKIQEDSGDGF